MGQKQQTIIFSDIGKDFVICGTVANNLDHFFCKSSFWQDVLNQDAITTLSGLMSIHTAFCIQIFLQIVDMPEEWIFNALTKQVEYSFYGMNGPTIISETGSDSLVSRFDE